MANKKLENKKNGKIINNKYYLNSKRNKFPELH